MNRPVLVFLFSFVVMWASAQLGAHCFKGLPKLEGEEKDAFGFILGAVLTLLGLIIGFSFSMAIGRYDQRKNYEEEEANAIGTEYVRVEMLASADAARIRGLLSKYLDQRVLFYETREANQLRQINNDTAQLQNQMWSAVRSAAVSQTSPLSALAASGMNDVLNTQGYTQAAWWNRIPIAAWVLIWTIAICCNLLLGFAVRLAHRKARGLLLLILPLVLAISFLLLADIDSPRGGFIQVRPQNLISLSQSLHR
jgi:hypothetical protein